MMKPLGSDRVLRRYRSARYTRTWRKDSSSSGISSGLSGYRRRGTDVYCQVP